MSIQFKSVDLSEPAILAGLGFGPKPMPASPDAVTSEVMARVHAQLNSVAQAAVERAMAHADVRAKEVQTSVCYVLDQVKAELSAYIKPSPQVLAVEVNNEIRKLKQTASPVLGRCSKSRRELPGLADWGSW
jgi:hypothetical protein